jgi:tetratricopeptide (TPR) repeat protein
MQEALNSLEKAANSGDACASLPVQKAQALTALGSWDEALRALRAALTTEPEKTEPVLPGFIGQLFESIPARDWFAKATDAIQLFRAANALPLLGAGLVGSIKSLEARPLDARAWHAAWERVGKTESDLQLALRLLATAVEFFQNRDPRVLLELPVEERKLLQPLLKIQSNDGASELK